MKTTHILFFLVTYLMTISCNQAQEIIIVDERFHIKVVDLKEEQLKLYWKDSTGVTLKSFDNLKKYTVHHNDSLVYAMNAGMYLKDYSPQGLFIENHAIHKKLDTTITGYGNFYLQPNGVFYLTNDNNAHVTSTSKLKELDNIIYATQSGPMLVIDGDLHPAFNEGSKNVHIRNAVGILPDGRVLLVLSKEKINFYDLATFFKNIGCKNALYLDGFVSRIYDPENKVEQMDSKFGVMIGITK